MKTLDAILVNDLVLDEQIELYFEDAGDYWDPYVICLKIANANDERIAFIKDKVSAFVQSHAKLFQLDNSRLFFTFDAKAEQITQCVDKLITQAKEADIVLHLSVFHHNSLGSIWETLDWGLQLLNETQTKHPNQCASLTNDFTADNWQGICMYDED